MIQKTLEALARIAWGERIDPRVYILAHNATEPATGRQDKMRALVDELHSRFEPGATIDADDACVFVAAAAMSVGIPCRFVGVRYGGSWTCWLSYQVDAPPSASCTTPTPDSRWEMIDPLRQKRPDRVPDEQVVVEMPKEST